MIQSITLDDKDGNPVTLHDSTGPSAIVTASGLMGVTTLRDSRRDRPQWSGGIDETRWESGRLITLAMEVSGVDHDDARNNFNAVTAPMLQTLRYGAALLKWVEGTATGGTPLQRYVRLADTIDPEIADNAARVQFVAQFYAEDPAAYSQTESAASSGLASGGGGLVAPIIAPIIVNASAGGTFAVDNQGTRPTPFTAQIFGQVTNPKILCVETGEQITIAGTINTGDYLEVNTDTRTLAINGLTSAASMLDSSNTRWFDLPPGVSTLRLLADSFDTNASIGVTWRDAY